MTAVQWSVFCEGESDKRFLECLARHLRISGLRFIGMGGAVSRLKTMDPKIRQEHDGGRKVAVILDANSDSQSRRRELLREVVELKLPIDREFLLPNDDDPGELETLLQWVAVHDHAVIHDCFDQYERCLSDAGPSYDPPHIKGRIYAYCEALGIETDYDKRDYTDGRYWNLEAAALAPLRDFLQELAES